MPTKLFVANISFVSTDDNFAALWHSHQNVEGACIMRHRATGASRGFGFVTVDEELATSLCNGSVTMELVFSFCLLIMPDTASLLSIMELCCRTAARSSSSGRSQERI